MAETWAEQAFNDWEREAERYEAMCPKCDICGEAIMGDYEYHIDGERMCEDCADDWWEETKAEAKREAVLDDRRYF